VNIVIQRYTYYRDDIDCWKAYFNRLPSEFQCIYQSPDYILFLEEEGLGKAVCQVFEEGGRFIYFPALLRPLPSGAEGYDLISSWYYGGPLSNWQNWKPFSVNFTKAIIEGRASLNAICEFIRCDSNLKNHTLLNSPFKVYFDRPTVIVNLSASWEEIVKGYSSQNRRNIKKAIKSNLDVHADQSELAWTKFAKIYQEEMVRKNAPSHLKFSDQFFKKLSKMSDFTLFTIRSEDEIIGGFISAHRANIAHHYLSAVQYDQWDKRPNNLLFSKVLEYFWGKDYKLFDFQGGRKGVFQFKTNFSKLRSEFYVATCIYDWGKFNELTSLTGEQVSTYFPPYRNINEA
jgi:hypothetical protein